MGIDTVTPIKLTAGQVQAITRPCASLVHKVLRGALAIPLLVLLASSPLWLLGVLAASLAYQPLQLSKHPAVWRCQPPQELQHCLPLHPCQPAAATRNHVLDRRMSYNLFIDIMVGETVTYRQKLLHASSESLRASSMMACAASTVQHQLSKAVVCL